MNPMFNLNSTSIYNIRCMSTNLIKQKKIVDSCFASIRPHFTQYHNNLLGPKDYNPHVTCNRKEFKGIFYVLQLLNYILTININCTTRLFPYKHEINDLLV